MTTPTDRALIDAQPEDRPLDKRIMMLGCYVGQHAKDPASCTAAQIIAYAAALEDEAKPLVKAAEVVKTLAWWIEEELTGLHRLACLTDDPAVRAFADDWSDRLTGMRAELPAQKES